MDRLLQVNVLVLYCGSNHVIYTISLKKLILDVFNIVQNIIPSDHPPLLVNKGAVRAVAIII